MKRILLLSLVVLQLVACAAGGGGSGASGGQAPDFPSTPNPNLPDSSAPPGSGGAAGGGGGSGSGGSSGPTYQRSEVPFGTPTLVGTFNPYTGSSNKNLVSQEYVIDGLTGGSGQDVVVAGRMTQNATVAEWRNSNIQLFSWDNGKLVNKTSQWFPGGSNSILGTDPTVIFEDFFKTGKKDMFVAPSTDMQHYGPAYLFKNNGNSFSRSTINIGNVWAHGATVTSLNNDGWKDVVLTDYGPNTTLLFNNRTNGFTPMTETAPATGDKVLRWGGSSIAGGTFMGNGKTQLIYTDNGCGGNSPGCNDSTKIHMYSWAVDPVTNKLSFKFEKNLPASTLNHAYLAITKDFDAAGRPSLIVFSRPNDSTQKRSAIQFMKNDGVGNFTDVTGSMLQGYNTNTYPSYRPQFVDLGNGQESMIVSGSDWSGTNNSTQILIKQSASGPYQAAFQNLITDFATQANQIANSPNKGNQINIVKDANNNVYLISVLQYQDGSNNMQQAVYLSPLGSQVNTATAIAAFNKLKALWPYMSPVTANTLLAQTSANYMTNAGMGKIIDLNAIMNPIGGLNVSTSTMGLQAVKGYIAGVRLASGDAVAMDSYGRAFPINLSSTNYIGPNSFDVMTSQIDQHELTSHAEYMVAGQTRTVPTAFGGLRLGIDNTQRFSSNDPMLQATNNNLVPKQYTIGLPRLYSRSGFSGSLQYTSLNQSPWFNFTGAWGSVTNSSTLEKVFNYQSGNFVHRAALTYTTTNLTPGLITNVTSIVGSWAESGYRFADYGRTGDWGMYLGVKPMVLSGSLTANVPTSVDMQGNTLYTQTKMGVLSSVTPYARALYTNNLDKQTMYRISGMVTAVGAWRAMAELRWNFN
jgi:hypothetical protein